MREESDREIKGSTLEWNCEFLMHHSQKTRQEIKSILAF